MLYTTPTSCIICDTRARIAASPLPVLTGGPTVAAGDDMTTKTTDTERSATEAEKAAGGHMAGNPRVLRAARSSSLYGMGVAEAMRHFRINHPQLKAARRIALAVYPDAAASATSSREDARLYAKVVRAEAEHPMIHRRVGQGGSFQSVASEFHLTRMRVCQIKHQLDEVVAQRAAIGQAAEAVLRGVERDARRLRAEA